jgi:hypothetical protein
MRLLLLIGIACLIPAMADTILPLSPELRAGITATPVTGAAASAPLREVDAPDWVLQVRAIPATAAVWHLSLDVDPSRSREWELDVDAKILLALERILQTRDEYVEALEQRLRATAQDFQSRDWALSIGLNVEGASGWAWTSQRDTLGASDWAWASQRDTLGASDWAWASRQDTGAAAAWELLSGGQAATTLDQEWFPSLENRLSQTQGWRMRVSSAEYTSSVSDLLQLQAKGWVVSYSPVGIAIKAANQSPEARAHAQRMIDKLNARPASRPPKAPKRTP